MHACNADNWEANCNEQNGPSLCTIRKLKELTEEEAVTVIITTLETSRLGYKPSSTLPLIYSLAYDYYCISSGVDWILIFKKFFTFFLLAQNLFFLYSCYTKHVDITRYGTNIQTFKKGQIVFYGNLSWTHMKVLKQSEPANRPHVFTCMPDEVVGGGWLSLFFPRNTNAPSFFYLINK